MFLRQSAAATLRLGPFLDKTDGVTEETGLSMAATDVQLSKGGGAFGNKNDATAPVHDEEGWYSCVLDATDTATLGILIVKVQAAATHLPVWHSFVVVPADVYVTLVAGTGLTLPGQAAPPLAPTLFQAALYLYKFLRNRKTSDATTVKVYADDETTVDHKATISDDGVTFTHQEFESGP